MSSRIDGYVRANSVREPEVARRLREATEKMPMGMMQVDPEQGQFLALLVEAIGARRCLEVGTFTGYSALYVALALPPDGKLICCDVSKQWTDIGRRYWAEAGVAGRIDLRVAPAIETLDNLIAEGDSGSFDFAFIDAEKTEYDGYYERVLKLLRPGGVVVIDNVLWGGSVADPNANDRETSALKALNRKLQSDQRISLSMLELGDGMTVACKRR
jgi:predicted O-methyltransferase YrrM